MNKDKVKMQDFVDATVMRSAGAKESFSLHGYYGPIECRDAKGNLKWTAIIDNLVTSLGKNLTLNTILGNASAGVVYMGLKSTGATNIADTQASHAGWLEVGGLNLPTYTAPRKTPTFSAAAAGSKATATPVIFNLTNSGTVAGCFINIGGLSTVDDTTGTLFSVGDFTTGNKIVSNGDVLSVPFSLVIA